MKKWLLRIFLGFVAVVALLYAFVFLRSIMPVTVFDKDLQLTRANIPEGANGYDLLTIAASHRWWPDEAERKIIDAAYAEFYSKPSEDGQMIPFGGPSIAKAVLESSNQKNDHIQGYLLSSTNWDAQLADTVLANNREALAAWDAAAKLPDFQVPEISDVNTPRSYLSSWKALSNLAIVRENSLFHQEKDKEAFDQILNHVQIARQMQNGRGGSICYLTGVAINHMALRQMQTWVGKTHLTSRQLKDYIHRLESMPGEGSDAFANAMRCEYQCAMGTIDALRHGKLRNPSTGKNYPFPTRLVPAFNLSQTKAMFAQTYLRLVKAASQHYCDAKIEAKMSSLHSYRPSPVSIILSGNAIGQTYYYLTTPAVGAFSRKSQLDVQLQATRTILALRAYQLAHSRLPADLNALVPEFLDEVPVDDFDGQPLRYSAERKIVYSVGKNLKDDGGDDRGSEESSDSQRHLDLVVKFDF